ncbi:MAG: zinc ribbon domain-containing protein [Bacilli bacterium]|nr:zinc ribbon domain-containing protein [Bacilli bacterium]
MIKRNYYKLVGSGVLFVGILILVLSYLLTSFLLFFLGVAMVVIGVLVIILLQALSIFVKDKELNIEQLKSSGLTIVPCPNCLKENVFEDKFCIHCGERLEKDVHGIQ